MTRSLAWAWMVMASLAAGCGGGGGGRAPGVTLHPVPGCESIDPAPCDVFDTSCQTRLLELAACMRGSSPGALPPVRRMTEAEVTQYLIAELVADDPDPDLGHYELGLGMLGLAAPGALAPSSMAATYAARAAGFYRPDLDDIVLVDRGEGADDAQVNVTMLHELVHALQDRDQDLYGWFDQHGDSYDASLAARSVVEGEARFHDARFRVSLFGLDPAVADLSMHFDQAAARADAWIRAQPSPYLASPTAFPYDFGARLIDPRFAARGTAIVPELFASPFADTRTLLDHRNDAPVVGWPTLIAPVPPADWGLTHQTTLGAWLTYVVLARDGAFENAHQQALSWRADHLWVYGGSGSATAVVWKLAFADAAVAASVAQGLGSRFPFHLSGSEIVIAATNTTLPLDWAFAETAAFAATAATGAPARSDGRRWWPRGNRPMLP